LGEVAVLSLRGATDHAFLIVVVVLLQWDGSGFPMVVPGLIGLTGWIAVLIGAVGWMLLTLLLRKWPDCWRWKSVNLAMSLPSVLA
jgi:hypothetical protein